MTKAKKLTALVLAIVMMFSVTTFSSFASDIDDQIETDLKVIISEFMPSMSPGLERVIKVFQKIITMLAPKLESEAPALNDFAMETGFDSDEIFKCSYTISTDMPFISLRTNIITSFEYRTKKTDGSNEWTEWSTVMTTAGTPAVYSRFNLGYIRDYATGEKINKKVLKPGTIDANTKIYTIATADGMGSIAKLPSGTEYAVRAIIRVNNSYDAIVFTSGMYTFTKA